MEEFEDLLLEADNLRFDGKVENAVKKYLSIASSANGQGESTVAARAFQLAASSLIMTISSQTVATYRDALAMLTKAKNIYIGVHDETGLGACLREEAVAAAKMGAKSEAIELFTEAIETLSRRDSFEELGITYSKYGLWLSRWGDRQGGLAQIEQALSTLRKVPVAGLNNTIVLFDQAKVLSASEQLEPALALALEAKSWFEADHPDQNYTLPIAEISGFLSVLYRSRGEQVAAERCWKVFSQALPTFDPLLSRSLQTEVDQ